MKRKDRRYCKLISLVTVFALAAGLCGCTVSVGMDQPGGSARMLPAASLAEAEYPFYLTTLDDESTIKLYFADDNKEIPYIGTDTAAELMERIYSKANRDSGVKVTVSENGHVTTLTRENGYHMTIDSENDVIGFDDYDAFIAPSWSRTVIDCLENYGLIDYLQIDEEGSYSRYGSGIDFETGKYGIDILEADGKRYIPLQTFSDTVLSVPCYTNLIYNGKAVFARTFTMDDDPVFISEIMKAGAGKRSRALADFTYNELCMALDHLYGLKEQQGVESFDEFFAAIRLKDDLLSEDPARSANALADALLLYLDDLHSFNIASTYRAGAKFNPSVNIGASYKSYVRTYYRFLDARDAQYPDGVPGYEEIDNTAYITFDEFSTLKEGTDYYKDFPSAETKDTVGLFLYAFRQITRKDSPVENVVFDLSLNGGGDQTTANFVMSMVLGGSSMVVEDTMTGAAVYERFRSDANLDGKFDDKDSLTGYNLFCITSPCSFSCGNLMASEFKNSNIVTMLGQTSGGGTCIIMPLSLADGSLIRVSGCKSMASIKNGSVYDIDRGIAPDLYIATPSAFYDRETLTGYINSTVMMREN